MAKKLVSYNDSSSVGARLPSTVKSEIESFTVARAAHTGTQTSASISDFSEAVQDVVAAMLSTGTNVSLTYNDIAGTLTIDAGGGGGLDTEAVRDAIGIAMLGSGLVAVTVNDAADTITISTTATANSTDASLRDRATHTGTQTADTITDGTTNKAFTAGEKVKLAGVSTDATNNTDESIQDLVAAMVTAGTNVTKSYNDAAGTLTLSAAGDASTNASSSVDAELALFLGTGGKTLKRATISGIPKLTSGVLSTAAAGTDYVTPTGTETLSNKRITKRVPTNTSSATPTINTDVCDGFGLTAQAVDITSFTTNLSGTPTNLQPLWIYIVPTATRAITWGASFEGSLLPTAATGTTRIDIGFVWNAVTSKWKCVGVC